MDRVQPVILYPTVFSGSHDQASCDSEALQPINTPVLVPLMLSGFIPETHTFSFL